MTSSPASAHTPRSLEYAVIHVFLPVCPPEKNDYSAENNHALARAVCAAAHAYARHVDGTSEQAHWHRVTKMLEKLQASVQSERLDSDHVVSQLRGMQVGEILVFHLRHQNAAIIFTKGASCTICEAFEASPSHDVVESTAGPLICSYPGSAVEMPNGIFHDGSFQLELAKFLSRCDADSSDTSLPLPNQPRYIGTLLSSILQSIGRTANISCVPERAPLLKRIRDHVGKLVGYSFWRRSPLWLLIRVAIQMSVNHDLGHPLYKRFVLFFTCTLAGDDKNTSLSSDLLHLMSSQILRRLSKLGPSAPDWLSETALKTSACLREILDNRWNQLTVHRSPFRNPSQDKLVRDTQASLLGSDEYIRNALADPVPKQLPIPFHPSRHHRGTIDDFLSSDGTFFDQAYAADPDTTLYDVGRSVEQGIDDWLAHVTNVDEACAQLETLMDKYMMKAYKSDISNPEDKSNVLLTGIELYVALDKLVMQEIPLLADYPPEIPIALLESLFLRNATSLHRLSCAYLYLSARHSQSRPGWSVLSNNFTEESFPVRYYNHSPRLQRLKVQIEKDGNAMMWASGRAVLEQGGARLTRTHDGYEELAERAETPSLLPASPSHLKAVVFELGCPTCFRTLRAAAPRILSNFNSSNFCGDPLNRMAGCHLLARVPALQPYHVERRGPPLHWQTHLAYVYPSGSESTSLVLCYVVQYPDTRYSQTYSLLILREEKHYIDQKAAFDRYFSYLSELGLKNYHYGPHTSNDVMAAQAECPASLSLDEFVAFAHLRVPPSLQWLNILHGLRSRTLNLRDQNVYHLLAYASLEVGPLDLTTGTWIWHQELQESSFCNNLLDELEGLFVDVNVGAISIDDMWMNTISLLLTRVLASSPSENISERAIALLRKVRRKTFSWMQELSYDLAKAPTNNRPRRLLHMVAFACRSTFEVDPAILHKLLHSAEDVDALLSCTSLRYALGFRSYPRDGTLHHDGGRQPSPALADILKDVILTDASDYGIDLAVGRIFPVYRPGTCRWRQHPDTHWLACNTETTMGRLSQMLHVNLHNAVLRVGDQPLGRLPREVEHLPDEIFRDQGFWVIPSNLPGMDFTTSNTSSKYKVHFSLRDGNLVLRAQCTQSNEILQLIPSETLEEDLPPALIDGHVHWLNLTSKVIEIRPHKQLWEESPENWRIDCASRGYRVYKGRETLVDIRSPTWAMVLTCFACINDVGVRKSGSKLGQISRSKSKRQSRNILITTTPKHSVHSPSVPQLSVALPRYDLSFFVNDVEELECRDFRGMVYDENQSIGALFGLENLLVLRPKSHPVGVVIPETLIHRRVIIPSGYPIKRGDHRVQVLVKDSSYVRYHTYEVDGELGCLIGNGSRSNTQFLAHSHVMTNYHRPDPLTGKTGAQTALCLLQSAVCRSAMNHRNTNSQGTSYLSTVTQYPQIRAAYRIMENGLDHGLHSESYVFGYATVPEYNAARRAAYLFPFHANGPASPGDCDRNNSNYTTHVSAEPGLPTLSRTVSSLRYVFNLGSSTQITLNSLICNRPAPALSARSTLLRGSPTTSSDDLAKLDQLFYSLRPDLRYQREYIAHLQISVQRASTEYRRTHSVAGDNLVEALKEHYKQCRDSYLESLKILIKSLGPTKGLHEQALNQFGQWPPVTADVLLRYLASTSQVNIPPRWKKCLTSFALLLLDLQRSRRLLRFVLDGLEEEFSKELENEGCDGWSAEEHPDWLLIQIQGNFLIRRTQAETAMELISPQSGENTVMQVNMGEGKSSVIIPIAASVLADGKQLVRVIVPKPLTLQMFELLASRLGGLTNRPVCYLPFSRTKYRSREIDDLLRSMSQCMTERGIVLLQPEHVASLKLMAVEQQIREGKFMADPSMKYWHSNYKYVKAILSFQPVQIICHDRHDENAHGASDAESKWPSLQKWLDSHARDILDENDQILHTRFQLVYTVGNQQHMDGYPGRWTITQQVLKLVKKHIYSISRHAPDSVECKHGPPGSFPHARILRVSYVCPRLISLIVEDVMSGRIPGFDFRKVSPALQDAIRSFISDEDVLQIPETAKRVEEYAKDYGQSLWSGLLQLRGLLTSNILLLALAERRWRVDYGLASRMRSSPTVNLAVPYRAKDVPFPNTQFGHPDLTIILTCLCHYYTGLEEGDLRRTFEILLDQNDPLAEYALWVEEFDRESVPDLVNINLGSSEQWDNVIFPYFAHNRATIDFYLSRVVFPKEAKEFPQKLSASSWDLAEKREKLITGMSGTRDERWLLPMSIAQRDIDHQKGTDARVLAYLLQPENDSYMVTQKSGEQWSTHAFLRMIVTQLPEIRILLDVGSQILDLSNDEVANAWLGIASDVAGVIYFNERDELKVLTRSGITQPARSSPLFQQLDRCIVYLDHAHTRGTDIKFPVGSRAAVTLGPKVTKDAVVQGCMRMRKLGHGHSVMFFAPPDVDRNIRATVAKTDPDARVTTVDVLCWAIHETWANIQQRAPHWAQQGMDHRRRFKAWFPFNASGKPTQKELAGLAGAWLQPEFKSLVNLYAPCETKSPSTLSELDPDIRQRCKDLGVLSLPKAQMEEEREREVCREHEREREVELPPCAAPAQHFLHPDVVSFVRTGIIPPLHSGSAFQPIFTTLEESSAITDEADVWSPFILATIDFSRTIEPKSTRGTVDQYLRPVQWILSSKRNHDPILVLISPFEAGCLMPDIRVSEHVHLHLYAPRTSQRMKPSDDLKFYSIPPLPSNWTPPWTLVDQLNVFAGQLYLRDYQSYLRVCNFLGVPTKGSSSDPGAIRRNLFDIPGSFEEMEITFSGSPLPFVMALLAMRSRGRPFAHTHMGKILQGQSITEKDFQ